MVYTRLASDTGEGVVVLIPRKGGRHGCHENRRPHEGGGRASSAARLTTPEYPAPALGSYVVAVNSSPGVSSVIL